MPPPSCQHTFEVGFWGVAGAARRSSPRCCGSLLCRCTVRTVLWTMRFFLHCANQNYRMFSSCVHSSLFRLGMFVLSFCFEYSLVGFRPDTGVLWGQKPPALLRESTRAALRLFRRGLHFFFYSAPQSDMSERVSIELVCLCSSTLETRCFVNSLCKPLLFRTHLICLSRNLLFTQQ